MNVSAFRQAFILHFGEMGSRWGINRTVGQIYALLFLSEAPLNAEDITEALGMSRSNVSMGLKELKAWRLVRLQHLPGDRREYFAAPDDVWKIFTTLVEERQKREIDPTMSMLRGAVTEELDDPADRHAQSRMRDMLELIELVTGWVEDMKNLERDTAVKLMQLGSGVRKFLAGTRRSGGGSKTTH